MQGEAEADGPSESECRPYIEKALKELEAGEVDESGSPEDGDSKEDVPTVEITTDDSVKDGDDNEDSKENTETTENEESDDKQSSEQSDEQNAATVKYTFQNKVSTLSKQDDILGSRGSRQ